MGNNIKWRTNKDGSLTREIPLEGDKGLVFRIQDMKSSPDIDYRMIYFWAYNTLLYTAQHWDKSMEQARDFCEKELIPAAVDFIDWKNMTDTNKPFTLIKEFESYFEDWLQEGQRLRNQELIERQVNGYL